MYCFGQFIVKLSDSANTFHQPEKSLLNGSFFKKKQPHVDFSLFT